MKTEPVTTDAEGAAPAGPGYSYQGRPSVEEELGGETENMESKVADQAQKHADKAKELASRYGEKAQDQIESGKDQAAAGMDKAAGIVRERSSQTEGMPAEAGARVADNLEGAAAYLREHSSREMWDDFESYIRQYPARALAGAVFAGFLFGRVLR